MSDDKLVEMSKKITELEQQLAELNEARRVEIRRKSHISSVEDTTTKTKNPRPGKYRFPIQRKSDNIYDFVGELSGED